MRLWHLLMKESSLILEDLSKFTFYIFSFYDFIQQLLFIVIYKLLEKLNQ